VFTERMLGRSVLQRTHATTLFAQIRTRFARDDSEGAAIVAMSGTARREDGEAHSLSCGFKEFES
jgi:hypothetical protein